ncbi:hypothetical protein ACJD0Z_10870 [Flavobacteriaceae bacterium M23B6Z8]
MKQPTHPFRTIQIICAALIAGVTFFLAAAFLVQNKISSDYDSNDRMLIIAILLFFAGATSSFYLVKRFTTPAASSSLADKLNNYQTRMIIRMALLEAPAFFAIVQFFLSGSLLYTLIPLFAIVLMAYMFPGKRKFIAEYELSIDDEKAIREMS